MHKNFFKIIQLDLLKCKLSPCILIMVNADQFNFLQKRKNTQKFLQNNPFRPIVHILSIYIKSLDQ